MLRQYSENEINVVKHRNLGIQKVVDTAGAIRTLHSNTVITVPEAVAAATAFAVFRVRLNPQR